MSGGADASAGLPGGVHADLAGAAVAIAERGGTLGQPLFLSATTASTNDDAKAAAREGAAHGAVWVAEAQTAGRGRRGHAWVSPPGQGLLFSALVRIPCVPARVPLLALVAGLAVRDAVARAAPGATVGIKWPNDVFVVGAGGGWRKVAGVLVEAVTVGARVDAIIVGVGINVHTRLFPDEITDRATSVALAADPTGALGAAPERASLLADVLASLDRDVPVVLARGLGSVRGRIEQADVLRGLRVRNDAGIEGAAGAGDAGIAAGVDDDGRLLVRRDDGVLARWSAGEVHLAPLAAPARAAPDAGPR